jgi:hypothetical protein
MPPRRTSATSSHEGVEPLLFGKRNEARNRPPTVGYLERLSRSDATEQTTRLLTELTDTHLPHVLLSST